MSLLLLLFERAREIVRVLFLLFMRTSERGGKGQGLSPLFPENNALISLASLRHFFVIRSYFGISPQIPKIYKVSPLP